MKTLTPAQQAAVLFHEGDSAILAGAGSGKTSVIVEKVAMLVERLHVPSEKILVVTFTEKAAAEVASRIAARLKLREDAPQPFVSTIHGFASEILRGEGLKEDPSASFRILNEFLANLEKARSVREKVLELVNGENAEVLDAVGRFGFHRSMGFFLDLLEEPPHRRSGAPFPMTISALSGHYKARKRNLGSLDFDDLEEDLLNLLRTRADAFRGRFSWVIVDEFQDTNPVQWDIISALQSAGPARLVIVGDPRQSIYRFRGADPSLFGKISEEIAKKKGRVFELSENFRSTPEVIAFVNAVSEPLFPKNFPPMKAVRADEAGVVERLRIPDEGTLEDLRKAEAGEVAKRLSDLRKEGQLWRSMAVLFKTRKAVSFYEKAFKAQGIPYRTSLGEPLLDRPEILSLLFWIERKVGTTETEKAFLETGLAHSALKNFSEEFPPDPLSEYLDRFFEATEPLFPEAVRPNLKAFRDLLNDLMGLGVGHLKALVQSLQALREDGARIPCPEAEESHQDAVVLMTVHGAKGLEWPVVVLGDLKAAPVRRPSLYVASEDGDLLLKEGDATASGLKNGLVKGDAFQEREKREREEELEESKRLLYVAMTRARDRLILPLPDVGKGDPRGKNRTARARWSDWLQP
jgi:ATP-dependent helicase/nuclease subunit A